MEIMEISMLHNESDVLYVVYAQNIYNTLKFFWNFWKYSEFGHLRFWKDRADIFVHDKQ